jgi:hypothetical protein
MLKTSLILAIVLVGCGPDISSVVKVCHVDKVTVQAEFELDCKKVEKDVRKAVKAIESLKDSDGFQLEISPITIIVRDAAYVDGKGLTSVSGKYWFPAHYIELARSGSSLAHELMHSVGYDHGADSKWNYAPLQAIEKEFDAAPCTWNLTGAENTTNFVLTY